MIIGIDLGTTNSLVSVWKDGRAQLVPNALGSFLTPSCVSIDDAGQVLVGAAARERLLSQPHNTAASFKRYMGTERRIRLGKRLMRPEELSALVLESLKRDAEAFLGETVDEAVITVPAYFNDIQRKATRLAGEMAGLRVERLLNEPTAAALAYGLHHADAESQFLIFDLGGGTFDVSILEMFSGVMEVRATAGDNFLGGDDFVSLLVDNFIEGPAADLRLQARRQDAVLQALLKTEAARVIRALSSRASACFEFREQHQVLDWNLDLDQFEAICSPLLERLRAPVERALRDARLRASDLERVVLVGGATRMPIVHRLVARLFGRFPDRDIHPDEAIALGAAVQAGLKVRDAALDDVVMTDVCPYTLGIEISESFAPELHHHGVFLPIIERNTVIPASRVKQVVPLHKDQQLIEIRIFQGESRSVADNIRLGKLTVRLPSRNRNDAAVDVRFTYDVNGLLVVDGTVVATGAAYSLVIEQSPGSMSAEEVQRSLDALQALKIHPRDQSENQLVLEQLRRWYQQTLGEQREWVGQLLSRFEITLQRQDPSDIRNMRRELEQVLEQFSDDPFA